jgi:lipoprotein NlpI
MKIYAIAITCMICSGVVAQKTANAYYELGGTNLEKGNFTLSSKYYDSTLLLDSLQYSAYFNRALAKKGNNDYEGALIDISSYLKYNATDVDSYLERGFLKFKLLDTLGAKSDYNLCVSMQPDSAIYKYKRAKFYADINQYDSAKRDFTELVIALPTKSKNYYNLGLLEYVTDDYESAIWHLNACIKLDSSNEEAIILRGRMKYFKRDYDGAISDFSITLSRNNKNIEALIWRAKSYYFNDKDYDDELGRKDLQVAIKLGSKEAEILLSIFDETGETIYALNN